MRGRGLFVGVISVVLLMVGMPGVSAAVGTDPPCGSTLTSNITLSADVVCSSGDGYTLGPGVTLNLNGHRLSGSSQAIGISGIVDSGPGTTARIVNGRLDGWGAPLILGQSEPDSEIQVRNPTVSGGDSRLRGRVVITGSRWQTGTLFLMPADDGETVLADSVLADSSVVGYRAAITMRNSTLRRSTFYMSGVLTVRGSVLDGQNSPSPQTAPYGVYEGLRCAEGSRITLTDSVVAGYGSGVHSEGCLKAVRNTTFRGNQTAILAEPGIHSGVTERYTVISQNEFFNNQVGLDLGFSGDFTDNVFAGNAAAINSRPGPSGQLIARNMVSRSGGTGITVGDQIDRPGIDNTVAVTGNRSVNNGGQGIVVGANVVDGGGNVASGNAGQPQCVGVVCAVG